MEDRKPVIFRLPKEKKSLLRVYIATHDNMTIQSLYEDLTNRLLSQQQELKIT